MGADAERARTGLNAEASENMEVGRTYRVVRELRSRLPVPIVPGGMNYRDHQRRAR